MCSVSEQLVVWLSPGGSRTAYVCESGVEEVAETTGSSSADPDTAVVRSLISFLHRRYHYDTHRERNCYLEV